MCVRACVCVYAVHWHVRVYSCVCVFLRVCTCMHVCMHACSVPAMLFVTDIAGLVAGAAEGAGLGNAFLSHIAAVDGLFHVRVHVCVRVETL